MSTRRPRGRPSKKTTKNRQDDSDEDYIPTGSSPSVHTSPPFSTIGTAASPVVSISIPTSTSTGTAPRTSACSTEDLLTKSAEALAKLRTQRVESSLKYEEQLADCELAALLAALKAGHSVRDVTEMSTYNPGSPLYQSHALQLAVITRLKYMITVISRLCYQIDKPDFLRLLVFGEAVSCEHHEIRPYLRELLGVALRSMQYKWNSDWDPDKTVDYGSKDFPVDIDMEESTESEDIFDYFSK